MLRRTTKIQLILFVVITLLGVAYVGAEYVGLGKYITGNDGCKISADFPDSGGIFTNAEVTYRGVTVGKVGELKLIKNGVRVELDLDSCSSPHIPASTAATVADRSVVGEQYVDLVPPNGKKPYISAGAVIPMSRNHIPTATQELLVNLDQFVNSVPLDDLHTTITELGNAVAGRGNDLGRLLDATDALLSTASEQQNLDATTQLIDESSSVLQTQLDEQQPLQIWTHSLNLLAQQLKASDADIQHLFDTGPNDLATVSNFISENRTDLGVTLANLVTVGDLLVNHLGGLEEVLELYPALAAAGSGDALVHDRQASLGLVLQALPMPQDCGDPAKGGEGYNGTVRRGPEALAPIAPNTSVRCTAPATGPNAKQVRGSANVPGGDPISLSGGGVAYPRAVTNNILKVGKPLPTTATLGDASWMGLVTDALH